MQARTLHYLPSGYFAMCPYIAGSWPQAVSNEGILGTSHLDVRASGTPRASPALWPSPAPPPRAAPSRRRLLLVRGRAIARLRSRHGRMRQDRARGGNNKLFLWLEDNHNAALTYGIEESLPPPTPPLHASHAAASPDLSAPRDCVRRAGAGATGSDAA